VVRCAFCREHRIGLGEGGLDIEEVCTLAEADDRLAIAGVSAASVT
jgi:hypothetical protein